jgi:hypothetical protein
MSSRQNYRQSHHINNNGDVLTSANSVQAPKASHPLEHNAEHRQFLIRSLDRSDLEICALLRLNRSLHCLRQTVRDLCGESILLDIGQGRLTLRGSLDAAEFIAKAKANNTSTVSERAVAPTHGNSDDSLEGPSVSLLTSEAQYRVCCDFLLHQKLRRKLMNRLARRLLRISHWMDGRTDAAPPPLLPSKFGDLRLHIDPEAVQDYVQHWKRQEIARNRRKEVNFTSNRSYSAESWTLETKTKDSQDFDEQNNDTVATDMNDSNQQSNNDIEENYPTPDIPSSDQTPDLAASQEKRPDTPLDSSIDTLHDEFAILREYKDSYEKVFDGQTTTYSLLLESNSSNPDSTHAATKSSSSPLSQRTMSKEKEQEHKRWQTSLLAKIPDQPTAQELGLSHRVFCLEERRNVIHQPSVSNASVNTKMKKNPSETSVSENDDSSDNGGCSEEESSEETENSRESDDNSDDDNRVRKTANRSKEKRQVSEAQKPTVDSFVQDAIVTPKRVKSMSLQPIPSFYEQDMKRIRQIHSELMTTSMQEHARRRITEATNEYNHAFRTSNDLYNQRVKLQNDHTQIRERHLMELNKLKNDFNMQTALARGRWSKQKEAWEINKAKKAMQGMYGQMPIGTNRTQAASRHPNQIYGTVGLILGRIVDAVVNRFEGGMDDGDHFAEFTPPPLPNFDHVVVDQTTGETYAQRAQRLENSARSQMQALTARLQQSEEDRKRAWRKLLKTKAEFDYSNQRRMDPNQIQSTPLPPLRHSQAVPHTTIPSTVSANGPAYIPPSAPDSDDTPNADSKYSAARVRERIASDGTVAPVSEPKRDKDGLFLRPAGRTRKGMNWDAVRGIWVPEYGH